jgi:NADPH:quinone reductase-like Zn-dependent oxidoreductase
MLAAYYALHKVAKVQRGERVLIQLTGPAGVAAVDVGRYLGAKMYAMVQSDEQYNAAWKAGVPKNHILDVRSIYHRRELEEATQRGGMAVVLALSGYETLRAWECLANFGRFVEIRTPGDHEKTRPELGVNASFHSVNMVTIAAERPKAMAESLRELVAKIEAGDIAPPTAAKEIPVSRLSSAIRMVREGAVESVVTFANIQEQVQVSEAALTQIFGR